MFLLPVSRSELRCGGDDATASRSELRCGEENGKLSWSHPHRQNYIVGNSFSLRSRFLEATKLYHPQFICLSFV
ncbi:unnamed protein product, partial [Brassica rapa subsp. trilocularis]|uniref:(rape) hypothetical protein n=1 Tax=Brassica napus TaxID=3708 RepID=A0A816SBC5_BRANA|nr:unnamed protein product [Brassica napus]